MKWRICTKPHSLPTLKPPRTLLFTAAAFFSSPVGAVGRIKNAAAALGEPLTADEVAAVECFEELADKHALRFRLAPGDALFLSNNAMLHARTKFVDGSAPAERWHLMRLWHDAPGKRPAVKEIQVYENRDGRSGIDGQDGRDLAGADCKYRHE